MAKQYNVNITGGLTNTDGVLSNFSSSNYATFEPFAPGATSYEIVAKVNSNSISTEQMIYYFGDYAQSYGALSIRFDYRNVYVFFGKSNSPQWDIRGNTTLQANTDYWIKLTYNGSNQYQLYLSTDGENYTSDGSKTNSNKLGDTNTVLSQIGIVNSSLPFSGTIDLNESYIKVNGAMWWRGVTNRTTIQLRHDTAANWTSVNPILLDGEVGIETDTRKQKFGDGITAWNSLPYDKGSTALQSITSSDVTTALGYTPVNKAGDTMTGSLTINNSSLTINNSSLVIKHPIARDGSTPSSGSLKAINFVDNSSSPLRFGLIESGVFTNGAVYLNLYAYKNQTANDSAQIELGWNSSGDKYCFFPNTTCVDGQWVNNSGQLASGVSLAIGNDQEIEYDISSYLPNDNYNYEVRFSIDSQTGSGSGAGLSINLIGTGTSNGASTWVRVNDIYARGSWIMVNGNHAIVPIGTDRKVKLHYTVISKAAQLNGLHIEAYRRIGDNE